MERNSQAISSGVKKVGVDVNAAPIVGAGVGGIVTVVGLGLARVSAIGAEEGGAMVGSGLMRATAIGTRVGGIVRGRRVGYDDFAAAGGRK